MSDFNEERLAMKYVAIRSNALVYSLESCISDAYRIGLTDSEKECIKNRVYTLTSTLRDFTIYQKDNFH